MKAKYLILCILMCYTMTNSNNALVDLAKVIPTIKTDIVYATNKNFTKKVLYTKSKCYALVCVAEDLKKIQDELNEQGLCLLVWDAYRPLSVQWDLWNCVSNKMYVADPRKGGKHTRGTAVDVTLVKLTDEKQLDMGTGHDDFSAKAHTDCPGLPDEVVKNRALLQNIMKKHNFTGISHEWWHFDHKGWQNFPSLDISFDVLEGPSRSHLPKR